MSISYVKDIPAANNNPSLDQPNMLINTNETFNWVAIDHIGFNVTGSQVSGQHAKVTFNAPLGSDPNQLSPIATLYTKTLAGVSQLYFQNGNMPSNAINLTGSNLFASGNDGFGGSYNIFQTPWGMRIFTGLTATINGTQNLTLSGGQTFGAAVFTTQASQNTTSTLTSIGFTVSASTGNFTIRTGAAIPVSWFVLST